MSNPYTGVLAIFAARILCGKEPVVFEDGLQMRDFVNVRDVATACRLALESEAANHQALNIASGKSYRTLEVARHLSRVISGETSEPIITGKYRTGDIRNCFADISKAQALLVYQPAVDFEQGAGITGLVVGNSADYRPGRTSFKGTEEAIPAVLEGRMRPAGFYTHYFPFDRLREALDLQTRAPEGFIKAIVTFD